jgi:4-hydroxybenzoate polyprenyltransferase
MASQIWHFIKPSLDAIVFSNTWISLGALSIYFSSKLLFGLNIICYESILVFAATFLGYNILKLKGLSFKANKSPFNLWMQRFKKLIYLLLFFATAALFYTFFKASFYQLILLFFTVLISLFYIGIERFNFRAFWFFKTQLVAFVWSIFILGISWVDHLQLLNHTALLSIFAGVFFLILSLTIPFEIRDWKVDKMDSKVKTIPMVFGLKGTIRISLAHLVMSWLTFLLYTPSAISLMPILISAGVIIYWLDEDRPEFIYTLILDGLIILIFPLLWLGSHFF